MANYEHTDGRDYWFFQALVESAKLNQMAINDEAAHRNKPNCRVQQGWRVEPDGTPIEYDLFDREFSLILQGAAAIGTEAVPEVQPTHVKVAYPTGPGLAPFIRRPIPIVQALNGSSTKTGASKASDVIYSSANLRTDFVPVWLNYPAHSTLEASIGVSGIDAGTDFRTSLVITCRLSNNLQAPIAMEGPRAVAFVFWRVIGHVEAYS